MLPEYEKGMAPLFQTWTWLSIIFIILVDKVDFTLIRVRCNDSGLLNLFDNKLYATILHQVNETKNVIQVGERQYWSLDIQYANMAPLTDFIQSVFSELSMEH